ncbi:hypothetical protein RCL1_001048 [Eukaryota sp. TZLM3-RCL]
MFLITSAIFYVKKLEFLVGNKFDSTTKKLISLPQRFGGLGATNYATINTISYCVSLFNCAINLNFIENLDENSIFNIFRKFNCDFTSFINIEFPENLQWKLTNNFYFSSHKQLISSFTDLQSKEHEFHLLPKAGSFMNVLPISEDCTFNDLQFTQFLQNRLLFFNLMEKCNLCNFSDSKTSIGVIQSTYNR